MAGTRRLRSDRWRAPQRDHRGGPRGANGWAIGAVVAVVVAAHLIYLLDLRDPNPVGPVSDLAVPAGPLSTNPLLTLDPNVGYTSQALGHRASLELTHLQLPWWNPYEGTGTPLAGEMQSAALFPPTLLLLISNGQLYEHMLLEIIAGIAMLLLLRRLGVNRWAAAAGGCAFALNGTFAWFGHAPVNPIAFLPVLVLGIEHAHSRAQEDRQGGWWLIAVGGALSFYGGFPEVTYLDVLPAVLWFLWRLFSLDRGTGGRLLLKVLTGGAVGVLLASPLLIASLDYLAHGNVGPHTSALLGADRLPAQALPQLLTPYVYGSPWQLSDPAGALTGIWGSLGGYLTVALAMLAMLGLVSRGRRGLRLVMGLWVLLALCRIYGQVPLLGSVLGVLPGMSHVAFFRYAPPAIAFGTIVLAALGLDETIRHPARRRALVASVGALIVLGLAFLEARGLSGQLQPAGGAHRYLAFSIGWGVASVLALGLAGGFAPARLRGPALAVIVAADALVMFVIPELRAPPAVRIDQAPVRYLQQHLGYSRVFTLGPLQPDYGSYWGLSQLDLNDLPVPDDFASYVHRRLDHYVFPGVFVGAEAGGRNPAAPTPEQELLANLAAYRQAAVSYVLTPAATQLPRRLGFVPILQSPLTRLYRLTGAATLMTAPGCRISLTGYTSASATCSSPSRLTYRETYLPGWSAQVSGRSRPITSLDGNFQQVPLPAGTHTVSFSYSPPHEIWGAAGLLLGLLALVASALRPRAGQPARMRAARTAALRALSTPTQATGTPGGI